MTDNEIIKALECCVTYEFCTGCPLVDNCPSSYSLLKSALNLINRQKAEKETMQSYIDCLKAENERLERHTEMYHELRAEAVKEFAERLKDMSEYFWEEKENFVSEEIIDNIVKEMVGDAE